MILNVGPDAKGKFPRESIEFCRNWTVDEEQWRIYLRRRISESAKPEWVIIQKWKMLYAHVFEQPIGPIALTGIDKEQIERLSFVHDGSEVRISNSWTTLAFQDIFCTIWRNWGLHLSVT